MAAHRDGHEDREMEKFKEHYNDREWYPDKDRPRKKDRTKSLRDVVPIDEEKDEEE